MSPLGSVAYAVVELNPGGPNTDISNAARAVELWAAAAVLVSRDLTTGAFLSACRG